MIPEITDVVSSINFPTDKIKETNKIIPTEPIMKSNNIIPTAKIIETNKIIVTDKIIKTNKIIPTEPIITNNIIPIAKIIETEKNTKPEIITNKMSKNGNIIIPGEEDDTQVIDKKNVMIDVHYVVIQLMNV